MEIVFGAMADPLSTQLGNTKLSRAELIHFQKDADAITRLAVRGIIAYGEARGARKRLVKK